MGEVIQKGLVVTWNGVAFTQLKGAPANQTGARGVVDVTHAGDTSVQTVSDILGAVTTTCTVSGMLNSGAAGAERTISVQDVGTLVIYREGSAAGSVMETMTDCAVIGKVIGDDNYRGPSPFSLSVEHTGTIEEGTA